MRLNPAARLGPYEILAPLGAGGMGEVYKARDTRLGRTVAIKILPEALAADPQFRERFDREARAISQLDHPHICALYDVGRLRAEGASARQGPDRKDGEISFLVMQYLDGETLADRLRRGPLPIDQAIAYSIQIAEALARAHRAGIIHRDLKPGNIMLTKSGATLLDFGLAKAGPAQAAADAASGPTTPAGLTVQGTLLGTFPYMATEQIEGAEADARSDIWAFGCVLYEMLAGRRAFEGKSHANLMANVLNTEPPSLSRLRPDVPPAMEWLIARCLEKDRERRWQDAHDLALQLRALQGSAESPGTRTTFSRREAAAWTLAALALLAALGLGLARRNTAPLVDRPLHRTSILPPPGVTFAPHHFAVSPDGSRLAFVAFDADGRSTLWIRSLDSGGTHQLADTDDAQYPFWAPDSRRVAFFAREYLRIADTATGATRPLVEAASGRGGAWSHEGFLVYAPTVDGPLFRVSEQGGQPQPATRVEPGSGRAHRWPWFLPDGRRFLYFEEWGVPSDRDAGIYVSAVDGGADRLLTSGMSGSVMFASGHMLFVQDASLMAQPFDLERLELTGDAVPVLNGVLRSDSAFRNSNFSVSRDGVLVVQSLADSPTELVRYADGRALDRIPDAAGTDPAVSPDGRFLAFTSSEATGRRFIRVHDFERGLTHRVTDGGEEGTPVWTPEGRALAYRSEERATHGIYERDAGGSGSPRLLLEGPRMTPSDYSPNRRLFAFLTFERGAPHVAVMDRHTKQVSIQHRGAEVQFHPQGEWVTFVLLGDVFLDRLGGGGPRIPISSGGGAQARWSRDGRRVYYLAPDRKMMEVPVDIRDGQASAGTPRTLFQTRIVASSYAFFQYDVRHTTPTEFIVSSLKPEAPVTLVSDWTALLPR